MLSSFITHEIWALMKLTPKMTDLVNPDYRIV
jgi:hypothetical protein